MKRGRFAPSPTGRMHLGNALSSLLAWLSCRSAGGEMTLRMEDLDPQRSREEYMQILREDLTWLGLDWDRESLPQSRRGDAYDAAINLLREQDLIYPCYCSRNQIHDASAPHASDGRVIYPGTCRNLIPEQRALQTRRPCLRMKMPDRTILTEDLLQGRTTMNPAREFGDIIVKRSDGVAAYQLAVVVDDGASGITEVVRGRDLLTSVPVQRSIQEALGLPGPAYAHVPMLLAADGRRLSKRDRDMDFGVLRERKTPAQVAGFLAWICGLIPTAEPVMPKELISSFSWDHVVKSDIRISVQMQAEMAGEAEQYPDFRIPAARK